MASRPSATARWVLATPGGPRSRTASPLAMNRPVAISRICALSSEKCAPKSKSGEIAHVGKAREPEGHVDPALIAAHDLPLAKQRQRLPDR